VKYFFDDWKEFAGVLERGDHLLFLSDYDGTLTPIVSRPELALLSPEMKARFEELVKKDRVSAGIISGRGMDEVEEMVGVNGIYYAGNHGLEIKGPGIDYINPDAERTVPVINELAERFTGMFRAVEGAIIQNKKYSLSVHYRLVKPGEEAGVEEKVRKETAPYIEKGLIRLFPGKKVWEIRPPLDWDKGKAVEAIRREISKTLHLDALTTVYLGDDTTDEDGFRAVQPPDGWSIYVGAPRPDSAAPYYLGSPDEVAVLLERITAVL
jgi:trehalose 6-phosphate phosphatase